MQETTNIARPYAKAAFEYALAHQQLSAWSNFLQKASVIVKHPQVTSLLVDPQLTREQLYELLCELCKEELDEAKRNLLRLMANGKRLSILPEVAELFNKFQAEHEQTLQVQVITVVALTQAQEGQLVQALHKRLARKIILNFSQDADIVGGILIRAGDKVIDLSLKGQLQRLNSRLRTV